MIVCDKCKETPVDVNGMKCDTCIALEIDPYPNLKPVPSERIYLEPVLFEKLSKLQKDVEDEKPKAKKALGKFMSVLKTSFIDKVTGKEINDPTPAVIIPKHSTIDRIQKILNHNISVYAEHNGLETAESLQDFTVEDIYSDDFEQSIYQYVDNIQIMEDEEPITSDPEPEPDPEPDPNPEE